MLLGPSLSLLFPTLHPSSLPHCLPYGYEFYKSSSLGLSFLTSIKGEFLPNLQNLRILPALTFKMSISMASCVILTSETTKALSLE